jgi:hypothetical protein
MNNVKSTSMKQGFTGIGGSVKEGEEMKRSIKGIFF